MKGLLHSSYPRRLRKARSSRTKLSEFGYRETDEISRALDDARPIAKFVSKPVAHNHPSRWDRGFVGRSRRRFVGSRCYSRTSVSIGKATGGANVLIGKMRE